MTAPQKIAVTQILCRYATKYGGLVGHGDCLGADFEFDGIAASLGLARRIYPCDLDSMRAHCETRGAVEICSPVRPLIRNGWIVRDSLVLVAAPKEYTEIHRSGTWSTIRRARKQKRKIPLPILILLPNGNLVRG